MSYRVRCHRSLRNGLETFDRIGHNVAPRIDAGEARIEVNVVSSRQRIRS